MDPTDKTKVKTMEDDACPRCQGKVYDLEKVQIKEKSYHKECLNCVNCKKILNLNGIYEFAGEIFCKNCYNDQISSKNFYMDPNSIKALKSEYEDDENSCVKCKNKVFENEKIMARSGAFHKTCLTCFECAKILDLTNYNDGRDGGVYCKNCYNAKYGARGRSQSVKRDVVFTAQEGDTKCPTCQGKIFDAEKLITPFGPFHVNCYKCFSCSKTLVSSSAYR